MRRARSTAATTKLTLACKIGEQDPCSYGEGGMMIRKVAMYGASLEVRVVCHSGAARDLVDHCVNDALAQVTRSLRVLFARLNVGPSFPRDGTAFYWIKQ